MSDLKYTATFVLLCVLCACQQTATNLSPEPISSGPIIAASSVPDLSTVEEDLAFKAELAKLLEQMEPGIQEKTQATGLTLEHAQSLIEDLDDSDFKLKSSYQPVPHSNLETRLLQENIFITDNLVSAFLLDGEQDKVRQRFVKQVEEIIGVIPFTDYGLTVLKKGKAWYVSFVLMTEILELKGVSLTLSQPKIQTYTGRLIHKNYRSPEVLITRPDGRVEPIKIAKMGEDQFQAEINFSQKGLYSVEVNLRGPLGPLPATNYIVAVQEDYPIASADSPGLEKITDLKLAQQKMLVLVNEDRKALGKTELTLDTALSQTAQAHCEDMVSNQFIGHNSPTVGTPQQQSALFKVTDLVAQNISVSRNLNNAQLELMSSPGHRQTILDPDHTHVGFGVATGNDGFLYITQLFVHRELEIEPLPFSLPKGQTLEVKGRSRQDGAVAVYIEQNIQGDYLDVKAGEAFVLPVKLNTAGKQRLRMGYAPPALPGSNLNFTFYNIWDMDIL